MSSLNAEEFEQALRECAAEPIHLIGKVQPHAGLLVLQPDGERQVLQASQNIAEFVSRPLAAVLPCWMLRPWPSSTPWRLARAVMVGRPPDACA